MNKLLIKKLDPKAILPTKGYKGDGGLDIYTFNNKPVILGSGDMVKVPTGLTMKIPDGTVGLIQPRSSAYGRSLYVHGVLDATYTGEVYLVFKNLSKNDMVIEPFSRYAQMVLVKYEEVGIEEVNELPKTERSEKGFGSSGIGK
jgi:dUTP pyrophosphatase